MKILNYIRVDRHRHWSNRFFDFELLIIFAHVTRPKCSNRNRVISMLLRSTDWSNLPLSNRPLWQKIFQLDSAMKKTNEKIFCCRANIFFLFENKKNDFEQSTRAHWRTNLELITMMMIMIMKDLFRLFFCFSRKKKVLLKTTKVSFLVVVVVQWKRRNLHWLKWIISLVYDFHLHSLNVFDLWRVHST